MVRFNDAGEDPLERGLPAPVQADQDLDLAGLYLQRNPV